MGLLDTLKTKLRTAGANAYDAEQAIKAGANEAVTSIRQAGMDVQKGVENLSQGAELLIEDVKANRTPNIRKIVGESADKVFGDVKEIGGKAGELVGAGLDAINPANLGAMAVGAEPIFTEGKDIGKMLGESIATVPEKLVALPTKAGTVTASTIDNVTKYNEGKITGEELFENTLADGLKLGATGIQSVFSAIAPGTSSLFETASNYTGLSEKSDEAQGVIASKALDALGITDEAKRQKYTDMFKDTMTIVSTGAGIKGAKVAAKGGLKNALKGTAIAATPDVGSIVLADALDGDITNSGKELSAAVLLSADGRKKKQSTKTDNTQTQFNLTEQPVANIEDPTQKKAKTLQQKVKKTKAEEPVAKVEAVSKVEQPIANIEQPTQKKAKTLQQRVKKTKAEEPVAKIEEPISRVEDMAIVEKYKLSKDITPQIKQEVLKVYGLEGLEDTQNVRELLDRTISKIGSKQKTDDTVDIVHYTGRKNAPYIALSGIEQGDGLSGVGVYGTTDGGQSGANNTEVAIVYRVPKSDVEFSGTNGELAIIRRKVNPDEIISIKELPKTEPVTKVEEPVAKVEEPVTKVEEPVAKVEEPVAKVEEPVAKVEELSMDDITSMMEADGIPEPETIIQKPEGYETLKGNTDALLNSLVLNPKNVLVSKTAKATDEAFTIGGLLERGMAKVGDAYITLRNILSTGRSSKPLFYEQISKSLGFNPSEFVFPRPFNITKEMITQGVTPNEFVSLSGKEKFIIDMLNNVIPDKEKNAIGKARASQIENFIKASYVYTINKGNTELLNKIFTPQEIELFNKAEQKAKQVYENGGELLYDYGVLTKQDQTENYTRYVQSQLFRDLSQQYWNDKKETEAEARNRLEIDAMLGDMETGKIRTKETSVDNFDKFGVSILKDKGLGEELDITRVHSPLLQAISYIDNLAQTMQNKTVVENFKAFLGLGKGKKVTPSEKAFIKRLFPDVGEKAIDMVMGLYRPEESLKKQAQEIISTITRGGATIALLGNTVTGIVQPLVSTIPRGIAAKLSEGVKTSFNNLNSEDARAKLGGFGYVAPYQPYDTRKSNILVRAIQRNSNTFGNTLATVGDALESGTTISSGAWIDYPVKSRIAVGMMKKALEKNGIDTGNDAIEIIDAWRDFATDPKNRDVFQIENDNIHDTMSWIGESTMFTKSNADIIRNLNLDSLSGYVNGQVNKTLRNLSVILGRTEASKAQRIRAVKQEVSSVLIYTTALAATMAYVFGDEDEDEKNKLPITEKIGVVMPIVNKLVGYPLLQAPSLVTGILSSPVSIPLSMLGQAMKTVANIGDERKFDVELGRLIDNVVKVTGVGRTVSGFTDVFTGDTLQSKLSSMAGVPNMEDVTSGNNARGRKTDTQSEAVAKLLGIDVDQSVLAFIGGKLDRVGLISKFEDTYGLPPSVAEPLALLSQQFKSLAKETVQPLDDIVNSVTGGPDGYDSRMFVTIRNTAEKLDEKDSLGSYLDKLGIQNPVVKNMVRDNIAKDYLSLLAKNNKDAIYINEQGTTLKNPSDINFGMIMNELKTDNPKMFNDILSGLARLSLQSSDLREEGMETKNIISDSFQPSKPGDDAAIASFYGTTPNTTYLSNQLGNVIQAITSTEKPKDSTLSDAEYKIEQLKRLDDVFRSLYQMTPITNGIERSMALKSMDILGKINTYIETIGDTTLKRKVLDSTPYIRKAIENGLTYRGFRDNTRVDNTTAGVPDIKTLDYKNNTADTTTTLIGNKGIQIPMIEKLKSYDPMKVQTVTSPIRQTTQSQGQKTLAELLRMR